MLFGYLCVLAMMNKKIFEKLVVFAIIINLWKNIFRAPLKKNYEKHFQQSMLFTSHLVSKKVNCLFCVKLLFKGIKYAESGNRKYILF